MEIFSPFHIVPEESRVLAQNFQQLVERMNVSDQALTDYVRAMIETYRSTLEQFFPKIASSIPFYAEYPFETLILRIGPNGVMIGHKPSSISSVKVMRPGDFEPPLETINILDIAKRWQVPGMSFDTRPRNYNAEEAKADGRLRALDSALDYFWQTASPTVFEQLCRRLLGEEKVLLENSIDGPVDTGFDSKGKVRLTEPGGFQRFEQWAFQFKHYPKSRVSANLLRELEALLEESNNQLDVICLLTSGDLTSIGSYITVSNPRIRVWDRHSLNRLINLHLRTFRDYFSEYTVALETLSELPAETRDVTTISPSRAKEFEFRLTACPSGQKHFAEYERIGIEIWEYLFKDKLGTGKPQSGSSDRSQRRDVLFPNRRVGSFFQRIAQRFDADFVVVDFKNYGKPVTPEEIKEVEQYANKAIGRFIVVVSRVGANKPVERAQHRLFRDKDTVVLTLSDAQMLEMIGRKEHNQNPEDVLEDLLDEFLRGY
jgi:hypothetical protein